MSQLTVKIEGVDKLKRALAADFNAVMRRSTLEIAHNLEALLSDEPGQPPPKNPRRWYERGFGPKWHSDPRRRPKKRRPGRYPIVYGGNWAGYHTSETLFKAWGVQQRGIGAIVGNKATYSPVVQHYKEQARIHKTTGWVTDKQAVDRVQKSGLADRIVQKHVKKVLKG